MIEKLNAKLAGHYRYYGVTDNFKAMDRFWRKVVRAIFVWLNRRSRRKSYTWKRFYDMSLEALILAIFNIYFSVGSMDAATGPNQKKFCKRLKTHRIDKY